MAFIPLMPLSLWAYAKAASADRGAAVARNERVFHDLRHMPGARVAEEHSYPILRWGVGGSFVPIDGYRTEFFLDLPSAVRPDAIVTHYARLLPGWRARFEPIDCKVLGLRPNCGAADATFRHGRVRIVVDVSEELRRARQATSYAVYVSQ